MRREPPPMARSMRELLATEREIVPMSEAAHRRAQLRARQALWHLRSSPAPSVPPRLRFGWVRGALVGVGMATAGFAAWAVAGGPESVPESDQDIESSAAQPSSTLEAPAPGTPSQQPPAEELLDDPSEDAAPEVQEATPASKRVAHRPVHQASVSDLELLDRARRALGTKDYQFALRTLRLHQRRFPSSQFAEERDALRVRALDGAGRMNEAKRAVDGFERRHPESVLGPSLSRPTRGESER